MPDSSSSCPTYKVRIHGGTPGTFPACRRFSKVDFPVPFLPTSEYTCPDSNLRVAPSNHNRPDDGGGASAAVASDADADLAANDVFFGGIGASRKRQASLEGAVFLHTQSTIWLNWRQGLGQ